VGGKLLGLGAFQEKSSLSYHNLGSQLHTPIYIEKHRIVNPPQSSHCSLEGSGCVKV